MAAKRGCCIKSVELRGHTPPNCSQKGGLLCTLLRHGATSRNTVPEKGKRKGARARHGLQAPCQRVRIDSEARWSTWERLPRACVAYTPFWLQKPGGIPPFDRFRINNISRGKSTLRKPQVHRLFSLYEVYMVPGIYYS